MKNVKVLSSAFALLSLSFVFMGCSKTTADVSSPTAQILVRNAWAVDYYYHNQDMTGSFNSSQLLFSNTGDVGYQKSGEIVPGNWAIALDGSKAEVITLQFVTSNPDIQRLNKSWRLIDRTSNSIQLEESDGAGNILLRLKTL